MIACGLSYRLDWLAFPRHSRTRGGRDVCIIRYTDATDLVLAMGYFHSMVSSFRAKALLRAEGGAPTVCCRVGITRSNRVVVETLHQSWRAKHGRGTTDGLRRSFVWSSRVDLHRKQVGGVRAHAGLVAPTGSSCKRNLAARKGQWSKTRWAVTMGLQVWMGTALKRLGLVK